METANAGLRDAVLESEVLVSAQRVRQDAADLIPDERERHDAVCPRRLTNECANAFHARAGLVGVVAGDDNQDVGLVVVRAHFPVDRPALVVNGIVEEDGGTGEPALEMRIGELLDLGVRGEPAKRVGRQGEVDPGCRQAGGIPAPPFAHRSEQLIERMDLGHRAHPRRHGAQPVPRAGEAAGCRVHREEQEPLTVLAKSRQGIALDVVDIQDFFVHLRGLPCRRPSRATPCASAAPWSVGPPLRRRSDCRVPRHR